MVDHKPVSEVRMLLVQSPVNGHRALVQSANLLQDGVNPSGCKAGCPGRDGFTHTPHSDTVVISGSLDAQLVKDALAYRDCAAVSG